MKSKKFIAVLTRCRDEFYIKEFCDYYLSQGIDDIHIIDDDSLDKSIYDFSETNFYSNVRVHYTKRSYENSTTATNKPRTDDQPNQLYRKIKKDYKWLIYVDVDEFIATKRNINLTIREQLEIVSSQNKSFNLIFVPWVLMSGSGIKTNPKSVVNEVVWRHDHDKRHPFNVKKFRCRYDEIEYKSIFKTDSFNNIHDHFPLNPTTKTEPINGIDFTKSRINFKKSFFRNLRNKDIENGYFLCYHYRYISEENCINKLNTNGWYINDGYKLENLKNSTYAEVYDDTISKKMKDD